MIFIKANPIVFASLMMCVGLTHLRAQDWPEFRGPNGNGIAGDVKFPIEFNDSVTHWKTPIPGKGWSSPVVFDEKIWLTTANENGSAMSVLKIDVFTGSIIQNKLLFKNESPDFCHAMNSYATPTPVAERSRVYVHFGKYGTACLDSDSGKVIWKRRDFECNHHRGPAASPILHNDRLIVSFDGYDRQFLVALDKQTGKTIWETERNIKYGSDDGDRKKAYCTGALFKVAGKPILIYPSAVATVAYDPVTGEQIWIVYHDGMNASARPISTPGGLVLITNGMGQMVAVDPKGKGDISATNIRWKRSAGVPKKSSLMIVEDLLYMSSDKGVISCVDPETGKDVWVKRVGGEFAASPIFSGDSMYFFSRSGDIHALKPAQKFEQIGKSKLGAGFMASPAVANDMLILRSTTHLYGIKSVEREANETEDSKSKK